MSALKINVGAIEPCTTAMGPGKRFCIWVQGCPLRCRKCATPEFQVESSKFQVTVDELFDHVCEARERHGIQGLSFSGGEPFAQAQALADLARRAQTLGLPVLSWSGFTLNCLRSNRAPSGSSELLAALDVLVDGPFVLSRITDQLPLRGSANQRLHLLTDRYDAGDFAESELEARLDGDTNQIVMSGVTDAQAARAILQCFGIAD